MNQDPFPPTDITERSGADPPEQPKDETQLLKENPLPQNRKLEDEILSALDGPLPQKWVVEHQKNVNMLFEGGIKPLLERVLFSPL